MRLIKRALIFCALAITVVIVLQWVATNGLPYTTAVTP
jgi:hypothetical protein